MAKNTGDGAETDSVAAMTEDVRRGRLREWLTGPLRPVAALGAGVFSLGLVAWLFTGKVSGCGERGRDGANVRQVMQASLIFAADRGDRLPVAKDVWDYARQLAQGGALNDGTLWFSRLDPAYDPALCDRVVTVLAADRDAWAPEFLAIKPAWAVTLGGLNWKMPPKTPVAWTRGLQPDGTWAAHAPYGTAGGYVAFLGGEVSFFRNTRDAFERFDGKGKCSNVLDALPPESRFSEYTPTAEEARAWAAKNKRQAEEGGGGVWSWETAGWFVIFLLLLVAVLTAMALAVVLALDAARVAWRKRQGGRPDDKP